MGGSGLFFLHALQACSCPVFFSSRVFFLHVMQASPLPMPRLPCGVGFANDGIFSAAIELHSDCCTVLSFEFFLLVSRTCFMTGVSAGIPILSGDLFFFRILQVPGPLFFEAIRRVV